MIITPVATPITAFNRFSCSKSLWLAGLARNWSESALARCHDLGERRDARPRMYEYELQADADFVFKKYGSYGSSFNALITQSGYENLSVFVPIEIPDIEKLMKERRLSDAALKWPGRR
jgi:hypothetical protein